MDRWMVGLHILYISMSKGVAQSGNIVMSWDALVTEKSQRYNVATVDKNPYWDQNLNPSVDRQASLMTTKELGHLVLQTYTTKQKNNIFVTTNQTNLDPL